MDSWISGDDSCKTFKDDTNKTIENDKEKAIENSKENMSGGAKDNGNIKAGENGGDCAASSCGDVPKATQQAAPDEKLPDLIYWDSDVESLPEPEMDGIQDLLLLAK